MTPLPAKPKFDPANPARYYVDAAKFFNALRRRGATMPMAIGFLANGDMESDFEPEAVGDNDTAFNVAQWHWNPRGSAIFKATGIDVRDETDFDQIVSAIWWELVGADGRPGVEAAAYAKILPCTTGAEAARQVCAYYEGAGAAEAAERRAADGNFWSTFVSRNLAWVEAQG